MINFIVSLFMGFKEKSFQEAILYTSSILFYVIIFCHYMEYNWVPFATDFRIIAILSYVKGVMDYRERVANT